MEKFICPICQKELKNLNVYNSHLTWHKNIEKFPDGVDCPLCQHHFKSLQGLYKHVTLDHPSEEEKITIYRFFSKDEEIHYCENCNKEALLISPSKGFERYCSIECRNILNKKSHKLAMENVDYSNVDFNSRNEKTRVTCQERYGTDNPAQSAQARAKYKETVSKKIEENPDYRKEIMEKRIATNNIIYGCDHGLSSPEVIQKRVDNLMETKGVVNVFQLEEVKEKSKQTHLENCGYDNPSKSPVIKQKKVNTSIMRYGVEHPSQTDWFKDAIRKFNQEHYGTDSFFQTDIFKLQFKETSQKNWGFDHPRKNKIIADKIENTNLIRYNSPSPFGDKGVQERSKETLFLNFGVKSPMQSPIILNRTKQTCMDRYETDNFFKSAQYKALYKNPEWLKSKQQKEYATKKANGTFNTSKPETELHELLKTLYPSIEYQKKDYPNFPFNVDFYIPEYDLLIEYQGSWTHGKEAFDETNEEHLAVLSVWKQKAETSKYYRIAIHTWTIRDPNKLNVARKYGLNYLVLYERDVNKCIELIQGEINDNTYRKAQ